MAHATVRERQDAIAATVECYRDHLIAAQTARIILRGLAADAETIRLLQHGFEGVR